MNTELVSRKSNEIFNQDSEIEIILEKFLKTKKSTNTKISYSTDLIQFFETSEIFTVRDFIQKTVSGEIGDLISDYLELNKKVDEKNPKRTLNPSTLNRKLFSLSSFYVYLENIYQFKYNPTKAFEALPTKKHSETHSLTLDEIQGFLNMVFQKYVFEDDELKKLRWLRNYILFLLLSYSLRRSEIVGLKWSDLMKNSKGIDYLSVHQKGDTYKEIPVNKQLKKYLDKFKTEKYLSGYKSNFIFTPLSNTRKGDADKPLSPSMVYKIVEQSWEELSYSNPNVNNEFRHYQAKIDGYILEKKRLQKRLLRLKNKKEFADKEGAIADYNKKIEGINKDIVQLKEEMEFHKTESKKITPHSFRKSFIELMIQKNENFINIINATGHTNVEMINYYQDIDKIENNSVNSMDLEIFGSGEN